MKDKACQGPTRKAPMHVGRRRVPGHQGDHWTLHRGRHARHMDHENSKEEVGLRTMEPRQHENYRWNVVAKNDGNPKVDGDGWWSQTAEKACNKSSTFLCRRECTSRASTWHTWDVVF